MKKHIVCFGDSNTHGYCADPNDTADRTDRFNEDERWTCLLQKTLGEEYLVLEEGLSGRTTVFSDPLHECMSGLDVIYSTLMSHEPVDLLIIMLGTNDCKTRYKASASVIAKGLDQVIRKARQNASRHFDLLVISPIHLGVGVGDADFDPEFDAASVAVSRNLANEYRKIALQNHAAFLNASDFAAPSVTDREHMDEKGHAALADAIYNKILALQKGLSHVI